MWKTPLVRRLAFALALALLAASACSDDGGGSSADDLTTTTDADESTPTNDDGPSPTTSDDEDGDEAALGSVEGAREASPNDDTQVPLRLEVLSLERIQGDVVEVRFRVVNTSDGDVWEPWSTLSEAGGSGNDVGGAALVDLVNNRKYLVLRDSDNVCLCSGETNWDQAIRPGAALDAYADFPAPPSDVTSIDFELPGFPPIRDLSIEE